MASLAWAAPCQADEGARSEADARRDKYRASYYATALACDATLDRAQDGARAEIAKTLLVKIEASSFLVRHERLAGGTSTYTEDARAELKTHAREELPGVTVPETWTEDGRQCALAVMDRGIMANWLRERVAYEDEEVAGYVAASDGAELARKKLPGLRAALRHAAARERHAERLAIVAPDSPKPAASVPLADLERRVREALDATEVCLVDDDGAPSELIQEVGKLLLARGLKYRRGRETTCPVVAKVTRTLDTPTRGRDGNWWATWRFLATLADGPAGPVFGSVAEDGRDGAATPEAIGLRVNGVFKRALAEHPDELLGDLGRIAGKEDR